MNDLTFREKCPKYMRLLMEDFGLDELSAAAIMGNAGHESAGLTILQEIKPSVPGSRGGFGWFQWTASRRLAFEAYCSRNGLDPKSDKANYGWLFVELKGPEKRAIPAVKAAKSLRDKVIAFEQAFERAGVKHYDSRLRWAEKALVAFRTANPVPPPPDIPPVVPKPPAPNDVAGKGIWAAVGAVLATLLGAFGKAMGWW